MSWRAAYWLAFALALTIYVAMNIWTLPAIATAAGELSALDLRTTGYSIPEARDFLAQLNDYGRAVYLGPHQTMDMAFPALLGIVLAGAVWSLISRPWLRGALFLIVLGGLFADYYENVLVARMLVENGAASDALITSASGATTVKSALDGLAIIAVLVALAMAGLRKWKAG